MYMLKSKTLLGEWGEFTSGERYLKVYPPFPVLKAGHPVPTALLMNISVGKCVGCGVFVDLK